jgi:release factor glutamine methyltransferase
MLPTPDLGHLKAADYQHIYEPAEDTFILLDALEKDEALLRGRSPCLCLEIGSGSGCVATFLAQLIGPTKTVVLCTDLNRRALLATQQTGLRNGVKLETIRADLMYGLHMNGLVDVLVFNPPYVPTPSEEIASDGIVASWAGGKDGREVIDRLLPWVTTLLSPLGLFYLVAIRENRPQEIIDQLAQIGLRGEVVLTRKAGSEHLCVIRFERCTV